VINLKAAKALGLVVAASLLVVSLDARAAAFSPAKIGFNANQVTQSDAGMRARHH
jgi:hypothetical protein